MFFSLIFLIASPLFGTLLDFISLREGIIFLAVSSFVMGVVVLLFKPKNQAYFSQ